MQALYEFGVAAGKKGTAFEDALPDVSSAAPTTRAARRRVERHARLRRARFSRRHEQVRPIGAASAAR